MRTLAMAVAALVVVAAPADAQMGKRRPGDDSKKTEEKKAKVDDKAYQEALKRIPDSKEKYDPWAVTKPPDADKKPSK
jgi:hypothetical protein